MLAWNLHMVGAPTASRCDPISQRYAIYGPIASGGMATVYYGRLLGDVGFTRLVAVKSLHPQFAADPEFSSAFLDEARVAARIRHPNVVSTLDVTTVKGEIFLVIERAVPGAPRSPRSSAGARSRSSRPSRRPSSREHCAASTRRMKPATRRGRPWASSIATSRRRTSSSGPMASPVSSTSA